MTMTTLRTLALLLGAALVASCGDEANQVIAGPEPYAGTRIRFFNFSVSAPGVHFYDADTKLAAAAEVSFTQDARTGIATGGTESVTGTIYGGVSSGGYYNSIAAGTHSFNARIAPVIDKGLKIATISQVIESGKRYSVYLSGTYNTTSKTTDVFVVEDPFSDTYDWDNAMVRFVNASANASPMTLYAKNQTTAVETSVGGDVAYRGAGTFVKLAPATYDLRGAVAGVNAVTRTGVTFTAGKYYTITLRGTIGVTGTPAPFLDNTANK